MGKSNATAKKLQEVIMAKTMESLNNEETKKSNKKVAATKEKTTSEEAIIVKPLKEKKSKKTAPVEAAAPKKESKKEKKESKPRELKYIYPANCKDSKSKKDFRAETRRKLRKFNSELAELKEGTKDYKSKMTEFNAFKKERGLIRA